jgi:nucleotide-binding universal stress UspA family protein
MKNIEKILILTDFGKLSKPLLNYGLALAESLDAQVWVQYVYQLTANVSGDIYISPVVLEGYEKEVHKKYKQLQEDIPALQKATVQLAVSSGDLLVEANELIDREKIDLVVMGNRSEGFLTNILGSTANKVIQHAHCPVLTIPQEIDFQPFRKLALAVDLHKSDPEVLSFLAWLAQIFGARIDIIHISTAPVPVDVGKMMNTLEHAFENLTHQFFHIHASEIEEGIERHVEGNNIDLLMLMPRKHPFFDSLFQKSISRQAAYQKKVPLLTLREQ